MTNRERVVYTTQAQSAAGRIEIAFAGVGLNEPSLKPSLTKVWERYSAQSMQSKRGGEAVRRNQRESRCVSGRVDQLLTTYACSVIF